MDSIETPATPTAAEPTTEVQTPIPTLRDERATDLENPENIDVLFPKAKITDYEVPRLTSEAEDYGPEHTALDMKLRTWVHHAGFPKGAGSFVLKEIVETAKALEGMSPAAQEIWARSEKLKLEKLWGENYEAMVQKARLLATTLDQDYPGFKDFLENTHTGNSATVIAQFAMQADVLMNKSDLRKKEGRR